MISAWGRLEEEYSSNTGSISGQLIYRFPAFFHVAKGKKHRKPPIISGRDEEWVVQKLAHLQGTKKVDGKNVKTGPSSKHLEKLSKEDKKKFGSDAAPGRDKILAILGKLEDRKKIKWVKKKSFGSMIILYSAAALRRERLAANIETKDIGKRLDKLHRRALGKEFLSDDWFELVILRKELMSLPMEIFLKSRKRKDLRLAELNRLGVFSREKIKELETIQKTVSEYVPDIDRIVKCISSIVSHVHRKDYGAGSEKTDLLERYRLKDPSPFLEGKYGELVRYFRLYYP